jgi:4'-phosphopantetheinyl transferase
VIVHEATVHLWTFNLDEMPPAHWLAALSEGEEARAQRFVFPDDTRRYRHGRATLRGILAAHTDMAPADLPLRTTAHGKPELPEDLTCHFNLSHSGPWAVLALSTDGHVGIDIEVLRPISDLDNLAHTIMSPTERAEWQKLQTHTDQPSGLNEREWAFFTCWTRKEAILKAEGSGLLVDPCSVHIGWQADTRHITQPHPGLLYPFTPTNDTVACLVCLPHDQTQAPSAWHLHVHTHDSLPA